MYYVPDGTQFCGYYECGECGMRFLHQRIVPRMICPYCGEVPDMEIGPDEEMPDITEEAVLLQVIEGEEEVVRMDSLLSLAITGGDHEWL